MIPAVISRRGIPSPRPSPRGSFDENEGEEMEVVDEGRAEDGEVEEDEGV